MKNFKTKNGITLISLVITIIVLLILAGIALLLILGDDGIANRAVKARKTSDIAGAKEKLELQIADYAGEYYQAKYVNRSVNANDVGTYVLGKFSPEETTFEENYYLKKENSKLILTSRDRTTTATCTVDSNGKVVWEGTEILDGAPQIQVGDYVNYDPTDGAKRASYISPSARSGWNNNQVFNLATYKNNGYGWRFLKNENGQIQLIAEEFIGPDSGGYTDSTYGTTYYWLQGREGYQYGITELNNICNFYGQGKYATGARSITVEDVNAITGFNPTGFHANDLQEYGNKVTYYWDEVGGDVPYYSGVVGGSGYLRYKHSSGFYWFNFSTEDWVCTQRYTDSRALSRNEITTVTNEWYNYYAPNLMSKTSTIYELLFGKHDDSTNRDHVDVGGKGATVGYWLASRFVYSDSYYPTFGMFIVYSGGISYETLAGSPDSSGANRMAILPIVTLKPGVKLEWNSEQNIWEIKDGPITGDQTTSGEDSDKISLTMVSDNGAFVEGDEVAIGDEHFYIIASDATKLTLLAKYNLNQAGTSQQNANYGTTACTFSNSNYWGDTWLHLSEAARFINLNTYEAKYGTTMPDTETVSNNALKKARAYGQSLGVTGRLLTRDEANTSDTTNCLFQNSSMKTILYGHYTGDSQVGGPSGNHFLVYWLGTSYFDLYSLERWGTTDNSGVTSVCCVDGWTGEGPARYMGANL